MQAETRHQISIVEWWGWACSGYKLDKRLLHHSANGGKRGKIEASIFKAMGLRAGFPDLVLLVPRGDKHGLFVEVKSQDGRLSNEQKEMMALLEAQGFATAVAWNTMQGISAIVNYLKTSDPKKVA